MFDQFHDIGTNPFSNLISEGGDSFPLNPAAGELFLHTTHGACVYCHDNQWRPLKMPA